MRIRNEDVAIRRNRDIGGLIKQIGPRAGHASFAERHQHAALRIELEDLMSLAFAPCASVTQRLPSPSIVEPCGKRNMPAPIVSSSRPRALYFRIGASLRPAQ